MAGNNRFRYESSKPDGPLTAIKRIQERRITDRITANRLKVIQQEIAINKRAAWSEKLDEECMIRR